MMAADSAEIETCLRVLEQARTADPADPVWQPVHEAVRLFHQVSRKRRNAARRAERKRHDRAIIASTTRFRDEDPDPGDGRSPRAIPSDRTDTPDGGTSSEDSDSGPTGRRLLRGRRCYVCKKIYREVHADYHLLCESCAEENLARRHARCDLRGRTAVVTGGRVKIGFHVVLKLLRDGADVLVTTRFPRDAARRFAAVPDSREWLSRLRLYGVDFLDLPAVGRLVDHLHRRFDHLDILVNNAAQTIRRPEAYYREVRAAEALPLTGAAAVPSLAPPDSTPMPFRRRPPLAGAGWGENTGTGAAGDTLDRRGAVESLFPAGRTDETGQPLDLRERNSWSLRAHEVEPVEWAEVHVVNAFVPFLLTGRLRGLLAASPHPDRHIVQVSAMEGSFSRTNKTVRHPHTNMAKASLNMLTRTAAADYAASGIHMNSVDTGWVTDERPHRRKTAQREAGFRPPLDVIDGAARVYDPIVRGVNGHPVSGLFLKDYQAVAW
jgi:NAD(P)-dependent dehydrogenase (short-subunit alcohol dehydrogenase family)